MRTRSAAATARLIPDVTIAALAMENGAEVRSNNAKDFPEVSVTAAAERTPVTPADGTEQARLPAGVRRCMLESTSWWRTTAGERASSGKPK